MLVSPPAYPLAPGPATGPASHYVRNEATIAAGKKLLDFTRASVKIPEAARAGRLGSALVQTALASPTSQLIDSEAPAVASALSHGRSFTAFDRGAYRLAAGIEVGLGVFKVANGVPNMVRAMHAGGPAALVNTRTGRDGVLQTASGALSLGLFARAAGAARAAGIRGVVPVAIAAATSESLAMPWVLAANVGTSALVLANEHGFLDFLDAGDTRSVRQVEHDAWAQLAVRQKIERVGEKAQAPDRPGFIRKVGVALVGYATTAQ